MICNDNKGDEYLLMMKRNTTTRIDMKNRREIPQRAWANKYDSSRCPVVAYKLYRSKRPIKYWNPDDPFYIQQNTNPEKSALWFKSQPVGVNKLSKFMKTIATNSGILRDKDNEADTATESGVQQKRLTNHSARKCMLQQLDDCGFEHNHIKQISEHKNIQSVSNYAKLSAKKYQEISSNLLGKTTCLSNLTPTISNSQQINILSPQAHDENLSRHLETIPKSTTSVGRGTSLFAGPVYGGTFHIYMNEGGLPPPKRRRPMIIESSDDSQ